MKKAALLSTFAVALLVFGALMAWGMLNEEPATGRSGITRVEKPAPSFDLDQFDGGHFAVTDHLGQPVVINFWASWCVPCKEEASALEEAWHHYSAHGVTFVGVDIQDTEVDARSFIQQYNITYPNGPDTAGRITIDYGVVGIPVTFFVDRGGVIVRRFVGPIAYQDLASWTEELIAKIRQSSLDSDTRQRANLALANNEGWR